MAILCLPIMNSKTISQGLSALTQAANAGTPLLVKVVSMVCVIAAVAVRGRGAESSLRGRGVAGLSGGGDNFSFRGIDGEIGGHGAEAMLSVGSAGNGRIALSLSSRPRS